MTARAERSGYKALALTLALTIAAACGGANDAASVEQDATSAAAGGSATSAPMAASSGTASSTATSTAKPSNAASGGAASAAAGSGAASSAASAANGGAASAAAGSGASSSAANGGETSSAAGSGAPSTASAAGSSAAGAAAGSGASEPASEDPASCTGASPDKAPVIYIIGDSTASVYEEKLYPRMGWAQPLQEYFKKTCATIQDKALSGRSSKSFLDEGAWTPIRAALHEGDFVFIQFGHNDEKSDDATRYTEPFGSYQQHLSTYIDDTLAAKATPILMTSIERNKWSGTKLSATHGDYPEAVRQLAQKRQIELVDMTQLTHDYLQAIGQDAANKLFLNLKPGDSPNYPMGNSDDTHLQDKGAHKIAEIALADIARQRLPVAVLLDHVPTVD